VDLFKISDPSKARGNTVTAREMLDKGATLATFPSSGESPVSMDLSPIDGSLFIATSQGNIYELSRYLRVISVTICLDGFRIAVRW
jgi:hypothetical protein